MTFLTDMQADIAAAKPHIQDLAKRLLTTAEVLETDVATFAATPAGAAIIAEAVQKATAEGLPVAQVETLGKDALVVVQAVAATPATPANDPAPEPPAAA